MICTMATHVLRFIYIPTPIYKSTELTPQQMKM